MYLVTLLKILWLFQRNIFIASIAISIALGSIAMMLWDMNPIIVALRAYILVAPLFHYFTYEVKNRNDYYFYYNLGFSRIALWASTIIIGILSFLISLFI